jgi:hypothetical protein
MTWTGLLSYDGLLRRLEVRGSGGTRTKMLERMMKSAIPIAIMFFAFALEPSAARELVPEPQPLPSISTYCATIEPGNPFSKVYDYQAWSAFRARGAWDNRGSDACAKDPRYSPSGTSPFKPNPYPRPSWF